MARRKKEENTPPQWHADFKKGEVPRQKAEINLEYIKDYCMQDTEKAQWFITAIRKYNGQKAAHLKIRKDFVDKYYPEFNEKPKVVAQAVKPKTAMELCLEEVQAFLDSQK